MIRFRPTSPEAVLRQAEKEHRRTGHHRLSVFADAPGDGEDDAAVIQRLLEASELSGIDRAGNPKFYVCGDSEELLTEGFAFYKDEDDAEVPEHYSIDLGINPTPETADRFLKPFAEDRR